MKLSPAFLLVFVLFFQSAFILPMENGIEVKDKKLFEIDGLGDYLINDIYEQIFDGKDTEDCLLWKAFYARVQKLRCIDAAAKNWIANFFSEEQVQKNFFLKRELSITGECCNDLFNATCLTDLDKDFLRLVAHTPQGEMRPDGSISVAETSSVEIIDGEEVVFVRDPNERSGDDPLFVFMKAMASQKLKIGTFAVTRMHIRDLVQMFKEFDEQIFKSADKQKMPSSEDINFTIVLFRSFLARGIGNTEEARFIVEVFTALRNKRYDDPIVFFEVSLVEGLSIVEAAKSVVLRNDLGALDVFLINRALEKQPDESIDLLPEQISSLDRAKNGVKIALRIFMDKGYRVAFSSLLSLCHLTDSECLQLIKACPNEKINLCPLIGEKIQNVRDRVRSMGQFMSICVILGLFDAVEELAIADGRIMPADALNFFKNLREENSDNIATNLSSLGREERNYQYLLVMGYFFNCDKVDVLKKIVKNSKITKEEIKFCAARLRNAPWYAELCKFTESLIEEMHLA